MKYQPYMVKSNGEELYLLDKGKPILYSSNFTEIRSQATVYPTIQQATQRIDLLRGSWYIRIVSNE